MALTLTVGKDSAAGEKTPVGQYVMRLAAVEEAASTFDDSKTRLKLAFDINEVTSTQYPPDVQEDADMDAFDAALKQRQHWEFYTASLHPNSSLFPVLVGMLARTPDKGEMFDIARLNELLAGKDYSVTIGQKPWEYEGKSGVKQTIVAIAPYKAPRQRTRQAETEQEPVF